MDSPREITEAEVAQKFENLARPLFQDYQWIRDPIELHAYRNTAENLTWLLDNAAGIATLLRAHSEGGGT